MLSPVDFEVHWTVSTVIPAIYYFFSSLLNMKDTSFLRLAGPFGAMAIYLAIARPGSELAFNFYKVAAGVHLLSLGVYTMETGIPHLIGLRRTPLVHYWIVFNLLGFLEGVRRRMPEERSCSCYSLLWASWETAGARWLRNILAFAFAWSLFFLLAPISFQFLEYIFGVRFCQEGPCIYDLLFFPVVTRLLTYAAELVYFSLPTDLRFLGFLQQ